MFCDWLRRFLISKETQMWCACDIATFRKYIFGLHPQFLANRFMNFSNFLIDEIWQLLCSNICSLFSVPQTLQAAAETWGSHFVFGGQGSGFCIRDTLFFFFFCSKEDPNVWINVRPRRTLDWLPCPGSGEQEGDELCLHSSPVAGELLDKQALEKARSHRAVQHTFTAGVQQMSSWDGPRARNKQCWWARGEREALGPAGGSVS